MLVAARACWWHAGGRHAGGMLMAGMLVAARLHKYVLILSFGGPRVQSGVYAGALGEETLRLGGESYVAEYDLASIDSNGLFCTSSFSWSGGQGNGPRPRAWNLLFWVGMSALLLSFLL